jgi:hypothetical protein
MNVLLMVAAMFVTGAAVSLLAAWRWPRFMRALAGLAGGLAACSLVARWLWPPEPSAFAPDLGPYFWGAALVIAAVVALVATVRLRRAARA